MLYHCSAVIFSSWYGSDGRGRSSGLFNIKNVILCRKNLVLSFEQGVVWVLPIFFRDCSLLESTE